MAYIEEIKGDVKIHLSIEDDSMDSIIELMIKASKRTSLSYLQRTEEEIETNEGLKQLIYLDTLLRLNKRFSEGIKSQGVSGFSKTYEIEQEYKLLLASLNKVKVI